MKLLIRSTLLLSTTLPAQAQLASFDFIARTYHAAGYANANGSGQPDLFGYGLGALEQIAYDHTHKLVYGASERGFVTVIDFGNGPANAKQAPFAIPFQDTLTDIEVCGDYLFVASKDDPNNGKVSIYKTAKRSVGTGVEPSAEKTVGDEILAPEFVQDVEVGAGPDMIYANPSCTILGVANEGEGVYDTALSDPEGSVSLIKGPFNGSVEVLSVSLNVWTDDELLEKGVHMPLHLKALEYWDEFSAIADTVDFADARANYQPASNLEPEYLAWSADGSTLFVNLQENCALVTVDVETGTATNIFGYGLKDWSMTGIDVVEDGGFNPVMVEGLFSTRTPDSIASFVVDDISYIITANEGDDKEYGDYAEKAKANAIFVGGELGMLGATADASVFDPDDITVGSSKYFNAACNETNAETPFCSGSLSLTIGSSMVDYSDPQAPNIVQLVALGGRGITIYKVTDTEMAMVWDSGDQLEKEGYNGFPWAHNGIQDEEFSPVNGTAYELADEDLRATIGEVNAYPNGDGCEDGGDGNVGACPLGQTVDERSLKDGPAAEAVVVGEACGSRFAVTVAEKNSVGYLYNLDDVMNPQLFQTFHLSEASETLNPGVAYDEGTLGEIDAESIIFLEAAKSPTGKAAMMFAGAWSGTISYWEFTCEGDPMVTPPPSEAPSGSTSVMLSSKALSFVLATVFLGLL